MAVLSRRDVNPGAVSGDQSVGPLGPWHQGADRSVADIEAENIPSTRVAEKIGMRFIEDSEHEGTHFKRYAMTKDDVRTA